MYRIGAVAIQVWFRHEGLVLLDEVKPQTVALRQARAFRRAAP